MHNNRIKLKSILLISLLAASFSSYGINLSTVGDDGNPHTDGNGAYSQKNKLKSTAIQQLTIKNNTSKKITTIVVLNKNDQQVEQLNVNCDSGVLCNATISKEIHNFPVTIKMLDSNQKLLSVYLLFNSYGKNTFISTNNDMFGAYLFANLRKKSNYKPENLSELLTSSFASPEKIAPDIYEQLSLYYSAQVINGSAAEKEFYDDLLTKLNSKTKLTVKPPQNLKLKSPYSSGAFCSVYDSIFSVFGGWKDLLPKPGSAVIGSANGIIGLACGSSGPTLSDVMNKLDALSAQMQDLKMDIMQVNFTVNNHQVDNNLKELRDAFSNVQINYYNYQSVLARIYQANQSNSIAEYAGKVPGGLKYIMDNSNSTDSDIRYLFNNMTAMNKELNQLRNADRIRNMATSIQNTCIHSKNIVGEVIEQRNLCNSTSIQVVTYIMGGMGISSTMFKDEVTTINDQRKKDSTTPGISNNPWGNWDRAINMINTNETITGDLINKYFGKDSKTIIRPTDITSEGYGGGAFKDFAEVSPYRCVLLVMHGADLSKEEKSSGQTCGLNYDAVTSLWDAVKPNTTKLELQEEWWSNTRKSPDWVKEACYILSGNHDRINPKNPNYKIVSGNCFAFRLIDPSTGHVKYTGALPNGETSERWTWNR